jgi:predicted DNA-binding ribbon-helix-helix protein
MSDAERSTFKPAKRSTLRSRNITVMGRRTSVKLEPAMWRALRTTEKLKGMTKQFGWLQANATTKVFVLCSFHELRDHPN